MSYLLTAARTALMGLILAPTLLLSDQAFAAASARDPVPADRSQTCYHCTLHLSAGATTGAR